MQQPILGRETRAATGQGVLAMGWALLGVIALFVEAVLGLGERGIATVRAGLSAREWVALAALAAAFLYGEGVRALQRRWVPHVLERIRTLPRQSLLLQLLAPLYAMMLVGASARTLWRAWIGVGLIVLAVLIVRALPEPWRGIVDLSVALALAWGLGAILVGARTLRAST